MLRDWLSEVLASLRAGGRGDSILCEIVQLGLRDPADGLDLDRTHPVDLYFSNHENQRTYNTVVWLLLKKNGLLGPIRRLLTTDLKRGDEEYGAHVLKSYSRDLLEHFLQVNPSPAWVHPKDVNGMRGLMREDMVSEYILDK